jgi:hypothetical protein
MGASDGASALVIGSDRPAGALDERVVEFMTGAWAEGSSTGAPSTPAPLSGGKHDVWASPFSDDWALGGIGAAVWHAYARTVVWPSAA